MDLKALRWTVAATGPEPRTERLLLLPKYPARPSFPSKQLNSLATKFARADGFKK